ncbi:unnamed protein product [Nippostrongylus brasiliensis]|uniref:Uncharacterized protein n=1 Tax=Nippostrongylus brasiliensis TaxID=27835 RepID=A0A0N4XIJ9_NIPBR|nr:unnamed protein product [Nippostrongylus brasiliensis]
MSYDAETLRGSEEDEGKQMTHIATCSSCPSTRSLEMRVSAVPYPELRIATVLPETSLDPWRRQKLTPKTKSTRIYKQAERLEDVKGNQQITAAAAACVRAAGSRGAK